MYLVGAGPGDPGLITVRGAELLGRAGAVVHDNLPDRSLLDLAPAPAELHDVGRGDGSGHTIGRERIADLLESLARRHDVVVRLTAGDPFVFGYAGEELLRLRRAGIAWEVVPGVTSAVAAPAAAGIPVTHRRVARSVTFFGDHPDLEQGAGGTDWAALAAVPGTLVSLMGVGRLAEIAAALIAGGRAASPPAAVVRRGATPRQEVVVGTLADIAERAREREIRPPAVLVVGEVVALRERIAWFERRPLFGRAVLITRPRAQAGGLGERLRELGADVVPAPVFRIVPPADEAPLRDAAARLGTFDWVFLTSANGVDALFEKLAQSGRDGRAFGAARLAAIGPGTAAALGRRGVRADLVPRRFVAEGILEAFAGIDLSRSRVLVWRAEGARDVLPVGLRAGGASVEEVDAYRLADEPLDPLVIERIDAGGIDAAIFTSASTVRGLRRALGDERFSRLAARALLAAIGPVTADALRECGAPVGVEAAEHTVGGVVDALVDRLAEDRE
ncbi:MAG: uroporphyrinogen-III C-methyltransferase [Deltaproteobacteria bacterium]|nr:uroporphyrinogen-III C-methyltransferase [Deltaproteobacteria bacterium]